MKRTIPVAAVYSIIHFAVDFSCIAMLSGIVLPTAPGKAGLIACVLLYNGFAFAFQLPIGLLGDLLNKNALLAAFGCVLVALSCFVPSVYAVCITAGIGNACFHVGGGIDILNISKRKAALPGVFVAPGALGVFLGALIVKKGFDRYYLLTVLMLLCAAAICVLFTTGKNKYFIQNTRPVTGGKIKLGFAFMAACLFLTVLFRSYMGTILNYGFKADLKLAALFTACVVLGKASGGFIGDRFGWLKTGAATLFLSAVLFAFSLKSTAAAMLAVLLFNMTMPITLTALANTLKLGKGFAFGLTTFALFLGILPAAFGLKSGFFNAMGLLGITGVSCILLAAGLKLYNTEAVKQHD